MASDPKTDATMKAVLILLDSMSQEQRATVAMKLVKQGVTPPVPKPRRPGAKKSTSAAKRGA
jgi:hypothetical protein